VPYRFPPPFWRQPPTSLRATRRCDRSRPDGRGPTELTGCSHSLGRVGSETTPARAKRCPRRVVRDDSVARRRHAETGSSRGTHERERNGPDGQVGRHHRWRHRRPGGRRAALAHHGDSGARRPMALPQVTAEAPRAHRRARVQTRLRPGPPFSADCGSRPDSDPHPLRRLPNRDAQRDRSVIVRVYREVSWSHRRMRKTR
jgi:hypothetical protein